MKIMDILDKYTGYVKVVSINGDTAETIVDTKENGGDFPFALYPFEISELAVEDDMLIIMLK